MAAPTTVIFDYYFTLARPELTNFHALAVELGCAATAEEVELHRAAFVAARQSFPPSTFDGTTDPFRSFRTEWFDFAEELFARLGVDGAGHVYAERRRAAHRQAVLYDDVVSTLESLKKLGWRVAVLSDADTEDLIASVENHGLSFDAVMCSEELACYKPHQSNFEAICTKIGTAPADAVYVGDSPVTDVEGSRRAGLRPIWINRRQLAWPDNLAPPDTTIGSLHQLIDELS
jgi:2-haloalkanoic acid dehalogenase type II